MTEESKSCFLLHCCCAPCSTYPLQLLKKEFKVTLFFFNPNIHPEAEYIDRKREIERLSEKWGFPLIIGDYDTNNWFKVVEGLEQEPEGGSRCEVCYRYRMEKTCLKAKELKMACWGTTLSVSPHKKADVINRIGRYLKVKYCIDFMEADFKKKNGFKISCKISNDEGFYRQNYCGCIFSRRKS